MQTKRLVAEEKNRENKNCELYLTNNWWNETYSTNTYNDEFAGEVKLLKLDNSSKSNSSKQITSLPKSKNWDITDGDYRNKEIIGNKKDYLYYRELNAKINKYSIYLVMLLTFILTYFVSSILF